MPRPHVWTLFFAALLHPGCSGPCDPGATPFTFDAALTEGRVLDLMEAHDAELRADLECEQVCDAVREGGYALVEHDACTLALEEPTTDDRAEVVGYVSCAGTDRRACG